MFREEGAVSRFAIDGRIHVISKNLELLKVSIKRGIYLLLPNWPKPTTLRRPGILTEADCPDVILVLLPSSCNSSHKRRLFRLET